MAIALLVGATLVGCAGKPLRFRDEAVLSLARARVEGGALLRPAEFHNAEESLREGDALLKEGEREDAERYFRLTLQKGRLLEQEVDEYKAKLLEAERLAEAQKRAELERQAQEEANRLAQAKAAEAEQEQREAEANKKKPKPVKEQRPLLMSYTVRRGESLPLIASQPEVYGDRNLWPLIYRANRDQISDPRHLWPGQVLRIRRNFSHDEILEARRYAQERPQH